MPLSIYPRFNNRPFSTPPYTSTSQKVPKYSSRYTQGRSNKMQSSINDNLRFEMRIKSDKRDENKYFEKGII